MKYGIMGGFIKLAFAKTAFDYIEKEIPEMDMASYRKRVLKEYRAIVERTPGIGSMKDNMFVMTMYAGAFLRKADRFRKMSLRVIRRSETDGGLVYDTWKHIP